MISFSEENIDEYYVKEILKESTDVEKETVEILKEASILHEDLRNYGNLEEKNKPLVVSGILLALREIEHNNFSIDNFYLYLFVSKIWNEKDRIAIWSYNEFMVFIFIFLGCKINRY